MNYLMRVAALMVLAGVHSIGQAQLVGEFRREYVDGHTKACFRTQRAASVNASARDETLLRYCACTAEYIANLLNEPLAREIFAGNVQFKPEWNNLAANYCVKDLQKAKPASDKPVYRCPGPPVLYTDSISTEEAARRRCVAVPEPSIRAPNVDQRSERKRD